MSGLELVLIPIALAAFQLIQPMLHGAKEFKRKRREQELQVVRSETTVSKRRIDARGTSSAARREIEVTSQVAIAAIEDGERSSQVAIAAIKGNELTSQVAIAAIKGGERSSQVAIAAIKGNEANSQVTIAAIQGWQAATETLIQESRSSRNQMLWLVAVIAYLAYALGQAQGQNKILKSLPMFANDKESTFQTLGNDHETTSTAARFLDLVWSALAVSGAAVRAAVRIPFGAVSALMLSHELYMCGHFIYQAERCRFTRDLRKEILCTLILVTLWVITSRNLRDLGLPEPLITMLKIFNFLTLILKARFASCGYVFCCH